MTVEITQAHIQIVENVAISVARSSASGQRAGVEELTSQGLLILWEAALLYDESRGVPFEPWVSIRLQQRLRDWLRVTYGRAAKDGQPNRRMRVELGGVSLEQLTDLGHHSDHLPELREPGSVEETVMARLDVEIVLREIAQLTEHQRRLILAGFRGESDKSIAIQVGGSRITCGSRRAYLRDKLSASTGIEREKRPYERKAEGLMSSNYP